MQGNIEKIEQDLSELRHVPLEDLKLMRLVAKIDRLNGKHRLESLQRMTPIFLFGAMMTILFLRIGDQRQIIFFWLILLSLIYILLLVRTVQGNIRSRQGERQLGLINIVLEEKTGRKWSDD